MAMDWNMPTRTASLPFIDSMGIKPRAIIVSAARRVSNTSAQGLDSTLPYSFQEWSGRLVMSWNWPGRMCHFSSLKDWQINATHGYMPLPQR